MEPSSLPVEVFDHVLGYMPLDRETRLRTLCRLSLVSPRWHNALRTHIYSRWLHDGEIHSVSSLWKFLRAVLGDERIAREVRQLNIRNWTFGLEQTHGRLVLSNGDLDLIRNAVHTSELEHIETNILEAVQKADPRPFMALLLANLPNLTVLYAHLPETDIFFAEVLRKAVATRNDESNCYPLSSLRAAHLASAWNYRPMPDDDEDDDDLETGPYHLNLDHLWPIFQLPSIERLSVFDFDGEGAAKLFGNSLKTSSITDLTLVYDRWSRLDSSDTVALLTVPRALKKLSMWFEDWEDTADFVGDNEVTNADLWNAIRQHQGSLEHLDIHRDYTVVGPPYHHDENSYFRPMQGFKSLKDLSIQPEVLLGWRGRRGFLAPFCLKDTLPLRLESITFYGDENLPDMESLGVQLQNVIASTEFRSLSCIALEDVYARFRRGPLPLHSKVFQACRASGRIYEQKHPLSCTKGGVGRRYYRYLVEKREQMKDKLDEVRFAVGEYLQRMGSMNEDGDFPDSMDDLSSDDGSPDPGPSDHGSSNDGSPDTGSSDHGPSDHRPSDPGLSDPGSLDHGPSDPSSSDHLSLDDLDTYELPWDKLTRASLYGEVDADKFFLSSNIDIDAFEGDTAEEWDDLAEQIDLYHKEREEQFSREQYFEWEEEFHWDNPSECFDDSDGVW